MHLLVYHEVTEALCSSTAAGNMFFQVCLQSLHPHRILTSSARARRDLGSMVFTNVNLLMGNITPRTFPAKLYGTYYSATPPIVYTYSVRLVRMQFTPDLKETFFLLMGKVLICTDIAIQTFAKSGLELTLCYTPRTGTMS